MLEQERALGGPWTETGAVAVDGGVLAYAACGAGRPLILLHKLGGWIQDWRALAEALAGRYRVIAFDLPGHGASATDETANWAYALGESASAIAQALSRLGVDRAAFVGNSLGGCVATQLAADRPELVEKLVLISCAIGPAATREKIEAADRRSGFYDENELPIPRDAAVAARISGTLDVRIAEEMNASRSAAGRWVVRSERGVGLADLTGLLPSIAAPVLLVFGGRDTLTDRFEAPVLAGLSDGRSIHIPDAGRFPHQEQPGPTAEAIAAFLG
ncbi:MAG: alpha/beta hydrolase [Dehalococcoidia bacterium]